MVTKISVFLLWNEADLKKHLRRQKSNFAAYKSLHIFAAYKSELTNFVAENESSQDLKILPLSFATTLITNYWINFSKNEVLKSLYLRQPKPLTCIC